MLFSTALETLRQTGRQADKSSDRLTDRCFVPADRYLEEVTTIDNGQINYSTLYSTKYVSNTVQYMHMKSIIKAK